ncbi:hypothetical protein HDU81_009378 [Chytriomyces hyalinus]|nr:hypothetical protein HDU81_009378 [Chytriomyces hyalinus]
MPRTLESMPPEILDRIASFVRGDEIMAWCHAVPYFKYISKAIYDFGYPIRTRYQPGTVWFNFWPCVNLQQSTYAPFEAVLPVPLSHLHALQTYSTILSKHGGYARIDDSTGISVLGALPDEVEVWVHHAKAVLGTDEFFGALYDAKKTIRELYFGMEYFERCKSNPASLDLTAKWLVKLPIHKLRFWSTKRTPTQILGMLHQAPMIELLHLVNLEDCAAVALSECKLLRILSIANMFEGEESPEELVQRVMDVVTPTKIREVAIFMPFSWQT